MSAPTGHSARVLVGIAAVLLVVAAAVPIFASSRRWRLLAVIAGLSCLGILLIGLAWGALITFLDWGYCGRGDSNYGKLGWSLLPPGPTCTWTVESNGVDASWGPTPVMTIWLITLILLGVVARLLVRKARDERRSESPTE